MTCSDRKGSIVYMGLVGGKQSCLNEHPSKNIYFIRIDPNSNKVDKNSALFVLCMLMFRCQQQNLNLNIWTVNINSNSGIIIPHSIPGEYILNLDHPIMNVWSMNGLVVSRVPQEFLELTKIQDLPRWFTYVLYDESDRICSQLCTITLTEGGQKKNHDTLE